MSPKMLATCAIALLMLASETHAGHQVSASLNPGSPYDPGQTFHVTLTATWDPNNDDPPDELSVSIWDETVTPPQLKSIGILTASSESEGQWIAVFRCSAPMTSGPYVVRCRSIRINPNGTKSTLAQDNKNISVNPPQPPPGP
jgi:hypothetical protein